MNLIESVRDFINASNSDEEVARRIAVAEVEIANRIDRYTELSRKIADERRGLVLTALHKTRFKVEDEITYWSREQASLQRVQAKRAKRATA